MSEIALKVLGDRNLLGLIAKKILAIENFGSHFEGVVPLKTLNALSRVCARTRFLLSTHPDLACAKRVRETAFLCPHQTREKCQPYACSRALYELGNDGSPRRMPDCACGNQCPWCAGLGPEFGISREFIGLMQNSTPSIGCRNYQLYEYACRVEGNFAVASFYLAKSFPVRVSDSNQMGSHLSLGHVDLFQSCYAQRVIYCTNLVLDPLSSYVGDALFSGDGALLRNILSACLHSHEIAYDIAGYLEHAGMSMRTSDPPDWNTAKQRRASRILKRETMHPWVVPGYHNTEPRDRVQWQRGIRARLFWANAVIQLAVMDEFVKAKPLLRDELRSQGSVIFSEAATMAMLHRRFVREILVDLCVVKYRWFDAGEIAQELDNLILTRAKTPDDLAFLQECFLIVSDLAKVAAAGTDDGECAPRETKHARLDFPE